MLESLLLELILSTFGASSRMFKSELLEAGGITVNTTRCTSRACLEITGWAQCWLQFWFQFWVPFAFFPLPSIRRWWF